MLDFIRRLTSNDDESSSQNAVPPDFKLPQPDEYRDHFPAVVDLAAAPVHLIATDAKLRMDAGALVIEQKAGGAIRRPIEQVSAIHIYGGGLTSNAVISELAAMGRPIIWRSHTGYPISWNAPLSVAGLAARKRQYFIAESERKRLTFSKKLVSSKIINMRGLLRRRGVFTGDNEQLSKRLEQLAVKSTKCTNENSLLGLEGAASRLYFGQFPKLLKNKAKNQTFERRTKRPPNDLTNSLLSYLYSVLLGECICAVTAAGLDPRCGVFHKDRAARPALALDLMEPFRATIVDACVTSILNAGSINNSYVTANGTAILLTSGGKRKALAAIEKRYLEQIKRTSSAAPKSWRDQIHHDALLLADSFRGEDEFRPMRYP